MEESAGVQSSIIPVPIEHLLPDFDNPRLARSGELKSQDDLLKALYQDYYLDDLLVSFSHNGYFSEEPLIGYESSVDGEGNPIYTIVEGNRRLAALRLLLIEDDRAIAGAKNIPEPREEILDSLRVVPVKVYPSHDEIIPYMGVRHIAGVRPWDAMAKAKYIKYLMDRGYTVSVIKDMVGVKGSGVVERWLLTLYVLNQANSIADTPWDVAKKSFKFSWLYTSLGYNRIRQYLNLAEDILEKPTPDSVPVSSGAKLIDHMKDLYGPPDHPELRKVRESREISKLAAVYATSEALELLRGGRSLLEAFSKSSGEVEELITLVRDASYKLENACGLAPHHKKTPQAKRFAKRCLENAQLLIDTLED